MQPWQDLPDYKNKQSAYRTASSDLIEEEYATKRTAENTSFFFQLSTRSDKNLFKNQKTSGFPKARVFFSTLAGFIWLRAKNKKSLKNKKPLVFRNVLILNYFRDYGGPKALFLYVLELIVL